MTVGAVLPTLLLAILFRVGWRKFLGLLFLAGAYGSYNSSQYAVGDATPMLVLAAVLGILGLLLLFPRTRPASSSQT